MLGESKRLERWRSDLNTYLWIDNWSGREKLLLTERKVR